MALVVGEKSKPNFVKEREKGKAEKFKQVSLMVSGVKIREAGAKHIGLSEGDKVWFVSDKEGEKVVGIGIYKTSEADKKGLALGKGFVFNGKDFRNALLEVAGVTEETLNPKKGKTFDIAETAIAFDGHDVFMLTPISAVAEAAQPVETEVIDELAGSTDETSEQEEDLVDAEDTTEEED